RMIKPARTDRYIYFGRNPVGTVLAACTQQFLYTGLPGIQRVRRKVIPVGFARDSPLIAYPANLRARITKEKYIRLHLPHHLDRTGPVVVATAVYSPRLPGTAIVTVAPVGAVEPHFKHRPVILEQLLQLVPVIGNVGRLSVIGPVAFP